MRSGPAFGTNSDRLDAELLASATTDEESFGRFYERHARSVLQYFAQRTACAYTAADLCQETFAEALRTLDRYKPERAVPRAWLFGIARNQLKGFLRRAAVSDRALRRMGIDRGQIDHSDAVAAAIDLERLKSMVGVGMDQLSPSVRQAVQLRILHELPYSEVAATLDCTEGAARVRVARGLAQLSDDQQVAKAWLGLNRLLPGTSP